MTESAMRVRNELARIEDAARRIRNTHQNEDVVELSGLIARLTQIVREDVVE